MHKRIFTIFLTLTLLGTMIFSSTTYFAQNEQASEIAIVNGTPINVGDTFNYTARVSSEDLISAYNFYISYTDSVVKVNESFIDNFNQNPAKYMPVAYSTHMGPLTNFYPVYNKNRVYSNGSSIYKENALRFTKDNDILITLQFDVISAGVADIKMNLSELYKWDIYSLDSLPQSANFTLTEEISLEILDDIVPPVLEDRYYVKGSKDLIGDLGLVPGLAMEKQSDGTYKLIIENVKAGEYKCAVNKNSSYFEYNENGLIDETNNIYTELLLLEDDDVTFIFDPQTSLVTITADSRRYVTYSTYTLVGDAPLCNGYDWETSDIYKNKLHKFNNDNSGRYVITLDDVPYGTYEFIIVEDFDINKYWGDNSSTDNYKIDVYTSIDDDPTALYKVQIYFNYYEGTISHNIYSQVEPTLPIDPDDNNIDPNEEPTDPSATEPPTVAPTQEENPTAPTSADEENSTDPTTTQADETTPESTTSADASKTSPKTSDTTPFLPLIILLSLSATSLFFAYKKKNN